jgi:hypothetical protein
MAEVRFYSNFVMLVKPDLDAQQTHLKA